MDTLAATITERLRTTRRMNLSHYYALLISYAAALALRLLYERIRELPAAPAVEFERPAREFGFAMAAVICVLLVGQIYVRGLLLPATGAGAAIIESVNQIVIFSPLILLLVIRRQAPRTAWLPRDRVAERIGLGIALALISVGIFLIYRADSRPLSDVLFDTFAPQNLPHLVQVFLEDVSIAIIFVRLRAWIGTRWSIGLVATLFAAAHIPAMLAGGAALADLHTLLLDAALAVGILAVLQRVCDIWWFWWVHFAMDMMQYHAVAA